MKKINYKKNGAKKNRNARRYGSLGLGTMNLEGLESRQMMSVVNVSSYGAVANDNKDDAAAIRAAIAAAKAGDTVKFNAGVYNLSSQIIFDSGETYSGDAGATLKWSGLGTGQYGAVVAANSVNTTIDGLKFDGSGIRATDGYQRNLSITNNEITHTAKNTPGVYSYGGANNLKIEGNYFHDYAFWGVLLQGINQSSYSHNVFRNITQGGHILNPQSNVTASFNVGTGLARMGLEIQTSYGLDSKGQNSLNQTYNLTVEGNAFYDWNTAYWDSFGLSIMPQCATNTRVINNYIRATKSGGFSQSDGAGVNRWGYGIEYGTQSGECTGNTVIGPWTNHIICSTQGNVITGNKIYGTAVWGALVGGEPGLGGLWGHPVDVSNFKDSNAANAPTPPAWAVAEAANPLGTPVLPAPTPVLPESNVVSPTDVKASTTVSSQVDLSWSVTSVLDSIQIQRKSRDGSDAWVTIATTTGTATSYSDTNFTDEQKNNQWAFAYRLIAVDGTDSSNASAVVSAQLILPPFIPITMPDPTPAPAPAPAPVPDTVVVSPTNVKASASVAGQIDLSWSMTGGSKSVQIQRKSRDGSDTWVTIATTTEMSYSDKTFTDDQKKNLWVFAYRLIAVDGTTSSGASTVSSAQLIQPAPITAPDTVVPAPTKVKATVTSPGQIDLTWTAANGADSVQIQRKSRYGSDAWVTITTLNNAETSYTDADFTDAQKINKWVYSYRLVAIGGGSSGDASEVTAAQLIAPKMSYVSDMKLKEIANGWGVIERDRSNGETGANDGKKLTINGKKYAKGIGAHSDSKIEISLDGSWKTFTTDVGVDDETGMNGSVVFQVYLDGKLAYDSGVLTGKDAAKTMSVNVQGAKQMWLVVTDANDGNYFDHADWAGAKLVA